MNAGPLLDYHKNWFVVFRGFRVDMDSPSWNTMDPASQVTICMKMLYERQLTTTSGGNVSVRDDNNTVWVTPSVIIAKQDDS